MIGVGDDGCPEVSRHDWRAELDTMTICLCGELGVRCDRRELPHAVLLSCPICDVFTLFFWRKEVKPCPDETNPQTVAECVERFVRSLHSSVPSDHRSSS